MSTPTTSADEAAAKSTKPVVKNKQRVMLLSSRGTTYRHRHLMNDLEVLLPHCKKESKFDDKTKLFVINELADLNNCNNVMFFEAHAHTDLYLWLAKAPNGPSVKFHVQNVHTMDELHMTGNCLKGSRPLLSFDQSFDSKPQFALIKLLLTHTFGVPKGTRKSKPFIDHVFSFSILDGRIWFRNYQIVEKDPQSGGDFKKETTLVEIGPRFVLNPIKMFEGSFTGATLYENPNYVSTAAIRRQERSQEKLKRAS
ncbi:Ribosome biogenesis protein brx1 [Dimargaris verticillata]|uniref:Ribosome biogenesis protein brx1 n=1 Tax=Dimargaris verticillata TaxID=2761393 RepID=A0A9W8B8X7_9FUNG|nr:Ribosome biogenesis protein brx1 [Dimargaris verticillata]